MRVSRGVVAALALFWIAAGWAAGRLGVRAWSAVVEYTPPFRFSELTAPGERLDWRVVIVLVDGLRLDASKRMRNLDRLRMGGADLIATSGVPSYSRPGRANLVTGAPPEIHGATTNFHNKTLLTDNLFRGTARTNGAVAIAGSDLWRGLFGPDLAGAAFLESPFTEERGQFERVAPEMLAFERKALRFVLDRKPRLAVLDLVTPDYAAHEYGGRSSRYGWAVNETDRILGALADEVDLWRTLVVVTSDHGHLDEGGHGGPDPDVTATPLVMNGRGVRPGARGAVRQIDVAPTIAALLGLPIPAGSEGRVLFEVLDLEDRRAEVEARAKTQQAAFARDFAASLGVPDAHGAAGARAARLEADRRSRLGLFLLGLALPLAVVTACHRAAWRESAVGAAAGVALHEAGFRALLAREKIRLSLSAINHEEDVAPYFQHLLLLSAIAMTAAALVVVFGLARGRSGAERALFGLSAIGGAGLFLWADVLFTYRDQGLIMAWTIGDLARGFDSFVDLVRLQAVGLVAVLVPPLAWLAGRRVAPAALAVLLLLAAGPARSGEILADVPARPDPEARYLIYLHGRIIELQGPEAVSPQYGKYEYHGLLKAFASLGFAVVSEVRGPETGPEYAKRVAGQVRALARAGVPKDHVAVVGFSKGGHLARAAAAELADVGIRFVILAGCPRNAAGIEAWVPRMKGRMLSVYDENDEVAGSCLPAFGRAPGVSGTEVVLKLGAGHGAFYSPRKEWLDPVREWLLH